MKNARAYVRRKVIKKSASELNKEIDKLVDTDKRLARLAKIPEEGYGDLTQRVRDFAFRYAIESRTYNGWAEEFNVTQWTIQYWMNNPRVQELIAKIRYDMRLYAAGMSVLLLKAALKAYKDIFDDRGRHPDTLEVKRNAARDIIDLYKTGKFTPNNQMIFNVGDQSEEGKESEETVDTGLEVKDLIDELKEIEQLQEANKKSEARRKGKKKL